MSELKRESTIFIEHDSTGIAATAAGTAGPRFFARQGAQGHPVSLRCLQVFVCLFLPCGLYETVDVPPRLALQRVHTFRVFVSVYQRLLKRDMRV